MKTIGWIVTSSSRSGTRGIARRLRPVSSPVSRDVTARRRGAPRRVQGSPPLMRPPPSCSVLQVRP